MCIKGFIAILSFDLDYSLPCYYTLDYLDQNTSKEISSRRDFEKLPVILIDFENHALIFCDFENQKLIFGNQDADFLRFRKSVSDSK